MIIGVTMNIARYPQQRPDFADTRRDRLTFSSALGGDISGWCLTRSLIRSPFASSHLLCTLCVFVTFVLRSCSSLTIVSLALYFLAFFVQFAFLVSRDVVRFVHCSMVAFFVWEALRNAPRFSYNSPFVCLILRPNGVFFVFESYVLC